MNPSLIVGGQDSVRASLLEAADEDLQTADSASNELAAAERLQTALMLYVVLLDQVIYAYCWVAVCHIEPTACRAHYVQEIIICYFEQTTLPQFHWCMLDSMVHVSKYCKRIVFLLFLTIYLSHIL